MPLTPRWALDRVVRFGRCKQRDPTALDGRASAGLERGERYLNGAPPCGLIVDVRAGLKPTRALQALSSLSEGAP